MKVERVIKVYLTREGIDIPEERLSSIVLELKSWLKPSLEGSGIIKTQEGDFTLMHSHYGEPYHSLSAGAIRECLEKFFNPSGLLEKVQSLKRINILDIGFGLGYNVAVAIKKLKEINPLIEIEIISLEKEVPAQIPPMPKEFRSIHKNILEKLPSFEEDGVSFKLYLGDARESIKKIKDFEAHAVFHDGFSPYRNPELWSLQFLAQVRRLMVADGVWVSYTSSLPVRKALKELGFSLFSTEGVGRKRGGTGACFGCEERLKKDEKRKLCLSPYAIPFLDPEMKSEPLDILLDYRIRVELLKMAQGGLEPPTPRFSAGCSTN